MDAQLAAVLTGGRTESGEDLLALMMPSSLHPLMAAGGGEATPLSPIVALHPQPRHATPPFPTSQVRRWRSQNPKPAGFREFVSKT